MTQYISTNNDILDIKLENCTFIDLKNEMIKYNYPINGNKHHRGGVFHHSIWTAKAVEYSWSVTDNNNWIKKSLIDLIPLKYKNFSILAGFLHDIGKLDGRTSVRDFVKPKHDIYGFNMLINSCSNFYNILDNCIHPKNGKQYNKIIAFLAIISKHHLDLGNIMQNKLKVSDYIDNLFKSFSDFPQEIYVFRRSDIDILILILLLIQLCDVIGARPVDYVSKWDFLNNYNELNENLENRKTPWYKYYYDKMGYNAVEAVKNIYLIKRMLYFNTLKEGVGTKLAVKSEYLFNNKEFKVKYSTIPQGLYYYKSMNNPNITENDHKNFKSVSWFGSESTADIYLESKSFGGYQYQFQTNKTLKLLRLDDPNTIETLYKVLYMKYEETNNDYFVTLANKLQFAFGVGKSVRDIRTQKNKRTAFDGVFNYMINYKDIKRNSYHDIDKDIMNEIICPLAKKHNYSFSGYISNPYFNFHEEIALCKPWEDLKFVKLYKKYDFNQKCKIIYGGSIKLKKYQKKYFDILTKMKKKDILNHFNSLNLQVNNNYKKDKLIQILKKNYKDMNKKTNINNKKLLKFIKIIKKTIDN